MLLQYFAQSNIFVTFALSINDKVLSNMKNSELLRRLKDAGCILSRHGGSHDKWLNPKTGETAWVPRHAGEVAKGLALEILKKLVGE